jgi:diaminopropionate ammonia-lyase
MFHNPHARATLDVPSVGQATLDFHRRLPGYTPTPLVEAPHLAASLGLGRLWIKDESCRMGLPAFKILGASWAVYQALQAHMGAPFAPWHTLDDLATQLAPMRPLLLAAATDGNHGRAVAHMARLLGLSAHIFVPAGTAQARIEALLGEGAEVTVVDGTYDEAVARSAELAGPRCLVISDTSWPGYEAVPRQVIEGYSTIFAEVDAQLARLDVSQPDVVLVQMGVGALAAAVIGHYRRRAGGPAIVGVEPTRAACVLESVRVGTIVAVPGPHESIMAGLNCDSPSLIAWPLLLHGLDLLVAVDDERARQAMRDLASAGLTAGETGAAGLAGLTELLAGPDAAAVRESLKLRPDSSVLLIVTEGATDPQAYAQIVGRPAETCAMRRRCPLCQYE